MKIAKIQTKTTGRDYPNPPRNARKQWKRKELLLVFLTLEDGTVGIGEGWVEHSNPDFLARFIEENVAPAFIGLDLPQFESVARAVRQDALFNARHGLAYTALSALEIAGWDARGKLEGLPVYRLLGAAEGRVPVYASGGLYVEGQAPEDLGEEMAGFIRAGFAGVKIKVGGASLQEDVSRVAETRQAIGPDANLMVDASFSLSEEQARELFAALAPYGIHFFEAPLPPEEIKGWIRLHRESGFPLAGPELLFEHIATEYFLASGAVAFAQFDPLLVGGFAGCRRLAERAKDLGLPVTLHNSNSFLSFLASAHFATALDPSASVEYHTLHNTLLAAHGQDACSFAGGCVHLSDAPGFGIDVRPEDLP